MGWLVAEAGVDRPVGGNGGAKGVSVTLQPSCVHGGRGSDRNPGRSGGLWVEGSRGCSRTGRQ